MPRRKNDPAKVQATEEPEGKRVKVDSVSDEKPEEKISNSEADLMNIPVPDEDGVLLICGGTNWSLNGRKKPRKGDGLERTPGSKGPLSSTDGEDILVDFLSRNRSLLSISCAPDVKAAKKSDMESLLRIYHERGVYRTDKQIRKTINNFRTRIKWKTTQSQTGNQRVRLSLQEQKFSDLLGPISVGADEKCNFKSLPGLRKKNAKVGRNLFKPHRYSALLDVKFSKVISGCTANHSLAIANDGTVYSWGRNECGQLGHGGTDRHDLPKKIESLSQFKVVHAAVGRNHTLCLTDSGKVFAFGENAQGQLGIGKINSYVPSPTLVKLSKFAVDVGCGAEFSMVVDIKGSVHSFGCPEYGQLGNNTDGKYFVSSNKLSYDSVSSPFRIPLWREKTRTGQVIPIADVKIVRVVCGANHTIALDSKKRIFTWGFGGYGRLGHSEQKDEHTPRLVEVFDREMRGATRIFAGSSFSIAINEMGATFFWGLLGSISSKDTTMYPKLVQDLTGWNIKSIGCGHRHIAVSADDNIIVWGIGTTSGELGLGESRKSSANPTLMKALDQMPVLEIACGLAFTVFKVRCETAEDKEKLDKIPIYDPNSSK